MNGLLKVIDMLGATIAHLEQQLAERDQRINSLEQMVLAETSNESQDA